MEERDPVDIYRRVLGIPKERAKEIDELGNDNGWPEAMPDIYNRQGWEIEYYSFARANLLYDEDSMPSMISKEKLYSERKNPKDCLSYEEWSDIATYAWQAAIDKSLENIQPLSFGGLTIL